MADLDLRERPASPPVMREAPATTRPPEPPATISTRRWAVPITILALLVAALLGWQGWLAYMATPWTRDGTVRAYVVTTAPEVSGRIVKLPIADNQFVHAGDVLMAIDPTDYAIAVDQALAAVEQARANADNAEREAKRRSQLSTLETSVEEQQTYAANARAAEASYQQAVANLAHARVNLQRTNIRSPVNGYVTNLLVQLGDYATAGQNEISVVDADSFWVDGYFEETDLDEIRIGAPATIKLMGNGRVLHGHVESIARGIVVPNAQPGQLGLASVNPIFTWVRLAQRVPVRIRIDAIPDGVRLVAGRTASIDIDR